MIQSKKWLIAFITIVLAIVILLSLATYIIDPGFQFRVRDNTYLLECNYVAPGLVKNQTYDTILIGSSMTQNFDVPLMEEKLGGEILKIGIGGMNTTELLEYLQLAYDVDKADRYLLCIDISSLRSIDNSKNELYMFKNDMLSRLKYCLRYETWLRYLPIGVGTSLLKSLDMMPESIAQKASIDALGDWSGDYTCSRDAVVGNYLNNTYGVSSVNLDNLEEKMKTNIDVFFESIDSDKGEHIFFFPPYSSLFWCTAQMDGYFETYLTAKEYFYEVAIAHGCTVYDFQSAELVSDLDNYKDLTHYGDHINDWMTENMNNNEYIVTTENGSSFSEKIREQTSAFKVENQELFE